MHLRKVVFFILSAICALVFAFSPHFRAYADEAVPPAPRGQSAFERYLEARGVSLVQFGYDLFGASAPFEPSQNMPVNPDYVLGPGDELRISIWGKINSDHTITIDRDGKINMPHAGVVSLNGLTFSEARQFLAGELARYYLPGEVKLNVSLGMLRSVRVYVTGKAQRPGSYNVSSLSTVVNALFAAGGPSKNGSMRNIELRRGNKKISTLDLYDLLLKGDRASDARLASEDVIFIPPAGPLAAIAGEARSPAIYELKGETSVKGLIDLAGGLNETALKGRLQIDRVSDSKRQVVLETDLSVVDPADIKVQPGDLLTVYPVITDRRVVRLSGAVERDGEFGIGSGLDVRGLVSLAGGPKYFAYTEVAELTRITPEPSGPVTKKLLINLKKALEGDQEHNIALMENDYLFVRAVPEWELYRTVKITGEVRFPGTYTINKGETLSSLIERAGGYAPKAYLRGASFTRASVRELQQRQLDVAIDRLEQEVLSRSAAGMETSINEEGAKLEQAALQGRMALITKMRAAKAQGRISIRLSSIEDLKKSESDMVLEEGDAIHIPETPSQVQVLGAVYNQTAFVYRRDFTVNDYLGKAGGLKRDADRDEMYILKVDGTAVSSGSGSWGWDRESRNWGGGIRSSKVEPGDTIVVPEKIERTVWMREAKDLTQILYQIAVTAGVLIVAF
ncbi:MAG TPA: SLBB domain-containing protein [Thermodesulfobacteriota bacterium]